MDSNSPERWSGSIYVMYVSAGTYYALSRVDGTTTSNANFVTLLNSLISVVNGLGGGTILLRNGTYVVASSITLLSNVTIKGEPGVIIDARTIAASDWVFEGTGTLGPALNLNANANALSNVITLGSTGTIVEGDWVFLQSGAIWKSNGMNAKQGEIFRAGPVVLNTSIAVPLDGVIQDTYLTADTAHVHEMTPVENVTIDGISILGEDPDNIVGIYLTYAVNCKIINCTFTLCQWGAIYLLNVVQSSVNKCTMIKCNRTGFGYGVAVVDGCQGVRITDNTFQECRHGVTITSYTNGGIPRGIDVSGNNSVYGIDAALDCHNIGENIVFRGNSMDGVDYGINFDALSGAVIGNTMVGVSTGGIEITGGAECLGIVVANNIIARCGTIGIYVNTPYVTISGNVIRECQQQGIALSTADRCAVTGNMFYNNGLAADATYDQLHINTESNYVVVTGNQFFTTGAVQSRYAIRVNVNTCDYTTITGNVVTGGGKSGGISDAGTNTQNNHNT